MYKKEIWLLKFVHKFREILDSEENQKYRQLFPAFRNDLIYLNIKLVEVRYDEFIDSYDLQFFKGFYGDEVEFGSLNLKAYSSDMERIDREFTDHQNDQIIQHSFFEPLDFDEDGRVVDFGFIYPLQTIVLPKEFEKLEIQEFTSNIIEKEILKYFKNRATEPNKIVNEEFYEKAIELANKCVSEDGNVRPKVSAILIRDNKIIVSAFRGEIKSGEHAEYTLLKRKMDSKSFDFTNTTLITTLEPCTVRTSTKTPCAEHIKECGINNVIIGLVDPNPDITGKGILYLQNNGVSVSLFPDKFARELIKINKEFWKIKLNKYNKNIMSPTKKAMD